MAVYDVLPSQNLKYEDIRDTLNSAGGTVGNSIASAFVVGNNINYYSKYKPMSHPVNFINSDTIYKEANWGYVVPQPTDLSTFINNIINDSSKGQDYIKNGWSYNRPVGGNASPFRLGDFRGYRKDSVKQLFNEMTNQTEIDQNTKSFSVGFQSGTFKLSDFNTFNTYKYFGVAIAYNRNQNIKFKTANPDTISFDANEVSKIFANNGTYTIYGFMSGSLAQNIDSSYSNYVTSLKDVIALPINTNVVTKKYTGATSYFTFEIQMTSIGRTSIKYDLYVTNKSDVRRLVNTYNVKLLANAEDENGNSWTQDGYQSMSEQVSQYIEPNQKVKLVSNATYPYAAYKYLLSPWFVTIEIYYPNSEGKLTYAGSGQGSYG